MSRAVLFITFVPFFTALLWQKWISALTDQVVAACAAHPTCTFPFTFYLQFSKALNFSSSSSWPSCVALREQCPFQQDLQLNFTEHNGCPVPLWAPGDEFPTLHGSLGLLYLQQEQRNAYKREPLLRSHMDLKSLGHPLTFISLLKEPHSSDL